MDDVQPTALQKPSLMANLVRSSARRGCSTSLEPVLAAQELYAAIHQENATIGVFYCSPDYDLDALAAALKDQFGPLELIGCTTAGELGPDGLSQASITGFTLGQSDFHAEVTLIEDLEQSSQAMGYARSLELKTDLIERGITPSFGYLLVDGLSGCEEKLVSAVHQAIGDTPLFGGSAGDGLRFSETHVYHNGAFHTNAAVLALVNTELPFTVFKSQHIEPTDKQFLVTGVDAQERLVMEIDEVSAALQYARAIEVPLQDLGPQVFSRHPFMVRIGGRNFIRSIQKVNSDGSLTLFCSIEEGTTLTLGTGVSLVKTLRGTFEHVRAQIGQPQLVIGCDCILRRLEIDADGLGEEVDDLLAEHNTVGFCTYGEQFNAMHANQTFTGVAIGYPTEQQ